MAKDATELKRVKTYLPRELLLLLFPQHGDALDLL